MIPPVAAGNQGPEFYAASSLLPAALLLAGLPLALLVAARLRRNLDGVAGRLASSPGASLAAGATASLVTLVLIAGAGSSVAVAIPALLAVSALGVFGFLGLAAEARRLGGELRGREPVPDSPGCGSTAVGWLVLTGMPLLPVAGPLALLFLALRATGAAILGVGGR